MRDFLIILSKLDRNLKKIIVGVADYFSVLFGIAFSFWLSGFLFRELDESLLILIILLPLTAVLIFNLLGIYSSILRYFDISLIFRLFIGMSLTVLVNGFAIYFLSSNGILNINQLPFNAAGWMLSILIALILFTSSRLIANTVLQKQSEKRVVIYGAGSAGIQLASALKVSSEMEPVAFVDRNSTLHNTYLGSLKVLPPSKLRKLVSRGKVDEVLIAIPSASKSTLRSLLAEVEQYSIKVRILPGLTEIAQGKILVSELKEVDSSDLLGRLKIEAQQHLIDRNIKDKVVLITGAGGSIGTEIARQVSRNGAKKIILLDSNEFALYAIKKELDEMNDSSSVFAILGNVTDKQRIYKVCSSFKVATVYHAAAYKHVPIVEENPFEAVNNNILGTKHCLEASCEALVETFVLISTDKAVRPSNIMGATKRFSELILQAYAARNSRTKMTMVRFGNVIGSSGSAIPLFQEQIKNGGPVTVTDPNVIRYFMTITEAAELVLQAGAMGEGGDVFVLDMGEPIKILELARRLIRLSGLDVKDENNPNGDIEIKFTGLRPGEKLYEELLIGDNVSKTEHVRILKAKEDYLPYEDIEKYLDVIKKAEEDGDTALLKIILTDAISGFTPEKDIVDILYNQNNK